MSALTLNCDVEDDDNNTEKLKAVIKDSKNLN